VRSRNGNQSKETEETEKADGTDKERSEEALKAGWPVFLDIRHDREDRPMPRTHASKKRVRVQEISQEDLAAELADYSDRISTQVRTIAFGVLGLTWLLLVPRPDVPLPITVSKQALIVITLLCILAILAEFCQYLLAEKTTDETFDRAAAKGQSGTAAYDKASFTYRGQLFFYRLKFWLAIGAAGFLIFLLARALLE
jgi:hypothetical protein